MSRMNTDQIAEALVAYWTMAESLQKDELGERISLMSELEITPVCIQFLKHSDPEIRWQAIYSLQAAENTLILEIISALAEVAMKDESSACRALAISTLREYSGRYEGHQDKNDQIQALTIQALSDPDARVREAAASALSYSSVRAIPALIHALEDTDDEVRGTAAYTLGTLDAPQAIDALVRVFASDPNTETRYAALFALSELEYESVIPHLLQALRDPEARIRERAAETLDDKKYLSKAHYRAWEQWDSGAMNTAPDEENDKSDQSNGKDEEIGHSPINASIQESSEDGMPCDAATVKKEATPDFESLCHALQAPDIEIQKKAIQALEDLQDERDIPFLIEAVASESPEISGRAIKTLEGFTPGVVSEHILLRRNLIASRWPATTLQLLKNVISDDTIHFPEKCSLIEALGERGHDVLPLFLLALENNSEYVRKAAVTVFIDSPHPDALVPLVAALQDAAPMVRAEAAMAFAAVAGKLAVAPLCEQLQTEEFPYARERIVWALGEFDDPQAINAIRQCLQDEAPHVRAMAMKVLSHVAVDDVFQAAMQDLQSTNYLEREQAINRLGDIVDNLDADKQDKVERTLLSLVNDPETFVVRSVASALGEIATLDTFEALLKLADHSLGDIRAHALRALCGFKRKRGIERVLRALATDEDHDVRGRVALGLGNYHMTSRIRKALEDALAKEENLETRKCIRMALESCTSTMMSENESEADGTAVNWPTFLCNFFKRLGAFNGRRSKQPDTD